jgi:hypothetical protein
MALIFMDSFEDRTTSAAIVNRYDSFANAPTSATTGSRTGSRSLGLATNSSVTKLWASTPGSGATIILGFSLYMPSLPVSTSTFLTVTPNSGTAISLNVTSTGLITISGAATLTSTAVLAANTLLYLQFKVTFAGAASAYAGVFGSVAVGPTTFTDTGATAPLSFNLNGVIQTYIDDLIVADSTGTVNNTLLGQPKIECLRPTGAGSNAGLSVTGAASNWSAVSDTTPDEDSTYVSSSTAGTKDTYATSDLAATSGTALGIMTILRARKDDASARQICPEFHIGGTDYAGATDTLTTGYLNYYNVLEVSPATAVAFTVAEINAAEIGVKVIA